MTTVQVKIQPVIAILGCKSLADKLNKRVDESLDEWNRMSSSDLLVLLHMCCRGGSVVLVL